jgi:hypothetical protein
MADSPHWECCAVVRRARGLQRTTTVSVTGLFEHLLLPDNALAAIV